MKTELDSETSEPVASRDVCGMLQVPGSESIIHAHLSPPSLCSFLVIHGSVFPALHRGTLIFNAYVAQTFHSDMVYFTLQCFSGTLIEVQNVHSK